MKEQFIDKNFSANSLELIDKTNRILDEYRAQGFVLTLRQLYYQFVARGFIRNRQSEYKRLGSVINDARLAGRVDWEMIEDRTRNLEKLPSWATPEDLIAAAAEQYRSDIWASQETRVEVWIEKEALVGVIEPVCIEFRVPYFACRGYSSQSEQWRAGRRFAEFGRKGQKTLILHLGDHDPSGLDMTRDNADRLALFVRRYRRDVQVKRIALNMDQVDAFNPPPNPAKATDARFAGYSEEFGDESWELDALEPQVIDGLIRQEIEAVRDDALWQEVIDDERRARGVMQAVADDWRRVAEQYGSEPSPE